MSRLANGRSAEEKLKRRQTGCRNRYQQALTSDQPAKLWIRRRLQKREEAAHRNRSARFWLARATALLSRRVQLQMTGAQVFAGYCATRADDQYARRRVHPAQPPCRTTRFEDAGKRASLSAARAGRATSAPPQFGHLPFSVPSAQEAQKVHSNEQMRASSPEGSRSRSQHSQFGRISSMSARLVRSGIYAMAVAAIDPAKPATERSWRDPMRTAPFDSVGVSRITPPRPSPPPR